MKTVENSKEFDAIVIGSGTCGATIARELSRQGWSVLILERGGNAPLKETFLGIASMADEVKLGDGHLSTVRAITTGGSTSLYFAVANDPPLDVFRKLGIELSEDLAQVRSELPIAPLSDELLCAQAKRLRDSARSLGLAWRKNDMLIDSAKSTSGYSYDAKWKAKSYVEDAVEAGAILVTGANVHKVLTDGHRAIGVEYKLKQGMGRTEVRRAYGARVILAAGCVASPKILRDSGVKGVGERGFYCNPGYAMYGLVPGLGGADGFVGSMGCVYEEGIKLGDANVAQPMYGMMMLGGLKLRHLFSYSESIGIGVDVADGLGGKLTEDGRFHKDFSTDDHLRLEKGRQMAVKILKNAGAGHITDFGLTAAGRVGGLIRIQEHLDRKLETEYRNLHVCDGSVIPDEMRGTPTVTLVCLGKYLSRQLLAA